MFTTETVVPLTGTCWCLLQVLSLSIKARHLPVLNQFFPLKKRLGRKNG